MLHPASKLAAMLRPRSHRFALENRQLFDGAALVEAAHATDAPDAAHAAPAHAEAPHPAAAETHPAAKAVADAPAAAAASEAPAAAATPHAVYVMDQSVVDWQQVVQALPTGSEVILIDNRSDGVAQLAAALHGRTDISALQIVSHGASGQITLGDSVITADNIAEHAAQWAAIGASLTADGDILLYGLHQRQHIGSRGSAAIDQHQRLLLIHPDRTKVTPLPAGLLDQPAGGKLHPAVWLGIAR